jgi:hypothetical protein
MVELPLIVVELERENFHILIEGSFKDGLPFYWVVDTGASKTVLDVNLSGYYEISESDNLDDYQSAGINQGMMETRVGKMFAIDFNGLVVDGLKVALIDLGHVNEIYGKFSAFRVGGLLGSDVLMKYKCLIDYQRKIICFHNE